MRATRTLDQAASSTEKTAVSALESKISEINSVAANIKKDLVDSVAEGVAEKLPSLIAQQLSAALELKISE